MNYPDFGKVNSPDFGKWIRQFKSAPLKVSIKNLWFLNFAVKSFLLVGDDTAILSCGPSGGDNCKKTLCLWYYNFDNIFFQKRGDSSRTLALTRLRHPGHHAAQGSGHELVLALPDPVTCLVLLRVGQVLGPSQLQQRHEHVNKTWQGFVFRDQTHCDVNIVNLL